MKELLQNINDGRVAQCRHRRTRKASQTFRVTE